MFWGELLSRVSREAASTWAQAQGLSWSLPPASVENHVTHPFHVNHQHLWNLSLVSSALWKLKLRSRSWLPLKKPNYVYIKAPFGKFLHPSSTTIFPNVQQLETSPSTTCPFITNLQISFSTRCALRDRGQNPKQLAEPTLLAGLSEEMKAELLTHNTVRSSCFPPREESKGNGCECCSPTLWEWNPFWCKAEEMAEETHPDKRHLFTTKHQISSFLRRVRFPGALKNQAAGRFSGTGLISALRIRGTPSRRVRRRLMNDLAALTTTLVSLSEAAS